MLRAVRTFHSIFDVGLRNLIEYLLPWIGVHLSKSSSPLLLSLLHSDESKRGAAHGAGFALYCALTQQLFALAVATYDSTMGGIIALRLDAGAYLQLCLSHDESGRLKPGFRASLRYVQVYKAAKSSPHYATLACPRCVHHEICIFIEPRKSVPLHTGCTPV